MTEISPSIRAKTFSRRLETLKTSSNSCFSAILTLRCEATRSASEPFGFVQEPDDPGAASALDQDLHRSIGKAQQLEDGGHHADVVDVGLTGVVIILVLLGGEQDFPLGGLHRFLQSPDGLLPAHEERHRLVWKDDDVPQREDRKRSGFGHGHLLLSAPLH